MIANRTLPVGNGHANGSSGNGAANGALIRYDFAEDLPGTLGPPGRTPAGAAPTSPMQVLHGLLRGRYGWVIAMTLVLGAAGFALGFLLTQPTYRSQGLVQVRPVLPKIIYSTEQNSVLPMFEAFIDAQVSMIDSPRVRDMAMQSALWKNVGRGLSLKAVARFEDSLDVTHTRGTELIRVTFDDPDPRVAAIAVKAVLEAYQKIYVERDYQGEAQRLQLLEERRNALNRQLRSTNDRIMTIANEFGSDTPDEIYEFRTQELNRLEAEIRRIELDLVVAETAPKMAAGATTAPAYQGLSSDEIAVILPEMASLYQKRDTLNQNFQMVSRHMGPNHPAYQDTVAGLAEVERAIERLRQRYNDARKAGLVGADGTGPTTRAATPQEIEALRARKTGLTALAEKLRADTVELGRKILQLKALRDDADATKDRLKETKTRIEELSVESSVSGRISVLSAGEEPVQPVTDRRIQFGGLGGLLGALTGFGSILLLAFLDQRLHTVADTRNRTLAAYRILGVLPAIPADLANSEQAAIAAHGVHRTRTLLQLFRTSQSGDGAAAIAITSPAAGDGKTGLTAALGISFAAAHSRTLLIDFDMVGGGLTQRMLPLALRDMGALLLQQHAISAEQLDEARRAAASAGTPVEDLLVRRGYTTASRIAEAIASAPPRPGLLHALAGSPLHECVTPTSIENLSVLLLGDARPHHVNQVSPAAFRRIIDQAREQFDTVLVDTGPVLGSLEASAVLAGVDGVVMVLSRGEKRHIALEALAQVEAVHGRLAGLVFNRAEATDVIQSVYASGRSLSSQPPVSEESERSAGRSSRPRPLDPVVDAVICSAPAPEGMAADESPSI